MELKPNMTGEGTMLAPLVSQYVSQHAELSTAATATADGEENLSKQAKHFDCSAFRKELLGDIRATVSEVVQTLHRDLCKLQGSVREQQRLVCRLDMRVDHLESGLDERITKKIAELTPPTNPTGATTPPGLGYATAQPVSGERSSVGSNKSQRTIVVWGFQWNSHRQSVVAELQRCLLSLQLDTPLELYAPFLRGSKAQCVFSTRDEAESFKDRFNQSAKETDSWKHLSAGYERSDRQRKRAAALRAAQNALRACVEESRHKDVEVCFMSGRLYLGEHHLGAWRPLTQLFEWDEGAVGRSRLDIQQLRAKQRCRDEAALRFSVASWNACGWSLDQPYSSAFLEPAQVTFIQEGELSHHDVRGASMLRVMAPSSLLEAVPSIERLQSC